MVAVSTFLGAVLGGGIGVAILEFFLYQRKRKLEEHNLLLDKIKKERELQLIPDEFLDVFEKLKTVKEEDRETIGQLLDILAIDSCNLALAYSLLDKLFPKIFLSEEVTRTQKTFHVVMDWRKTYPLDSFPHLLEYTGYIPDPRKEERR